MLTHRGQNTLCWLLHVLCMFSADYWPSSYYFIILFPFITPQRSEYTVLAITCSPLISGPLLYYLPTFITLFPFTEVRIHGVGYYMFSDDPATRRKELDYIKNIHSEVCLDILRLYILSLVLYVEYYYLFYQYISHY